MEEIAKRIDRLPDSLAPLRQVARRYLPRPSLIRGGGVVQIGHRPSVAELYFSLTLYPGLPSAALRDYCRRFGIKAPRPYEDFLAAVNGAFCFGMSLCGVPASMLATPPLLDRTDLQCHDLATAATDWAREYRVDESFFHFGGRSWSYEENVGYFFDPTEKIVSVKYDRIVGRWNNMTDFLEEELAAAERLGEELRPSAGDAK